MVQDRPGQPVTITIYDEAENIISIGNTDSNGQIRFQVQLPDNQVYRSSVRHQEVRDRRNCHWKSKHQSEIPKQTATILSEAFKEAY